MSDDSEEIEGLQNQHALTSPLAIALGAFYLEHRRCGELESGVEDDRVGRRLLSRLKAIGSSRRERSAS